jgi:hypothetical protein
MDIFTEFKSRSIRGIAAGALLLASSGLNAATLAGETIGVSYTGTDYGPFSDSITVDQGNPEIQYGDATDIGGKLMLNFEVIDIYDTGTYTSFDFTLRGDGPDHTTTGYQTTGLDGSYVISLVGTNLVFDSIVSISSDVLGANDAILNTANNNEVTFDLRHLYFDISQIGIMDVTGVPDLGIINIQASISEVPVPAALPLLLSGLGLFAVSARRRKH